MNRILWTLSILLLIGAVLASPFVLVLFTYAGPIDWQTVGNVGQAFSFAATLLSGAALIGVVFTLRYQSQQIRVAQMQAIRSMHFELARMVMDNPDKYGKFWGYSPGDANRIVRDGYINQVLNHAKAGLDLSFTSDESVRAIATDLFSSTQGRLYWQNNRAGWIAQSNRTADRHFFEVVDAAYSAANPNP